MKNSFTTLLLIIMICAASARAQQKRYIPDPYDPASTKLYSTIAKLDSIYFGGYNTGKGEVVDSLTSVDLEFYHDQGGLMTSKSEYLSSLKKNIYGKVMRRLTPGSLEVYEIPGYGAMEFGYHSFTNKEEPGESHPSKFVAIWQLKDNRWKITRVLSLH